PRPPPGATQEGPRPRVPRLPGAAQQPQAETVQAAVVRIEEPPQPRRGGATRGRGRLGTGGGQRQLRGECRMHTDEDARRGVFVGGRVDTAMVRRMSPRAIRLAALAVVVAAAWLGWSWWHSAERRIYRRLDALTSRLEKHGSESALGGAADAHGVLDFF